MGYFEIPREIPAVVLLFLPQEEQLRLRTAGKWILSDQHAKILSKIGPQWVGCKERAVHSRFISKPFIYEPNCKQRPYINISK